MNNEAGANAGPGASAKKLAHRVSRPTATTRPRRASVTGVVLVDLTDLPPYDRSNRVRHRVWAVSECPAGATVRIDVGKSVPISNDFDGIELDHVNIEVVGTDVGLVGRWVRMLNEVIG